MGAGTVRTQVKTSPLPAVTQVELRTAAVAVVAVGQRTRHQPQGAELPGTTDTGLGQPFGSFTLGFEGEIIRHTVTPHRSGGGVVAVVEGVQAVTLPHHTQVHRPVGQARSQQLAGVEQRKIERGGAAKCVGHHHLRVAGAVDVGQGVDLERPCRHLPAVLAHAVHKQLHVRWQSSRAHKGGHRRGHTVGLQCKVARQLDASDAGGTRPGQCAREGVAHAQGHHVVLEGPAPGGVQPGRLPLPARAATPRCLRECGAAQHRGAAEGAHFGKGIQA